MNQFTRRNFLAAGAAVTALPLLRSARAAEAPTLLRATSRVLDVNGRAATVFGLVQPDGTHGLISQVGKRFQVTLENQLGAETLVHWHGLTPPSDQDGVPGLSQPLLAPGGRNDYDFALTRPGTNWMHSHHGLQEQQLLAAPLIVRDPAEAGLDEQEVVLLLHDFTFTDPLEIFAQLTGGMQPMNHGASMDSSGGLAGMDRSAMTHGGGMAHLNDVEFDAYLANDRTLADPEVVRVERGGQVRLRIINAAASTNFHLDLGALDGTLIAVDGHAIVPLAERRFPLAIAQRLDVRLQLPAGEGAFPVLALREGGAERAGLILATRNATVSAIPQLAGDPTPAIGLELEKRLQSNEPVAVPENQPVRTHIVELTGGMMPFNWGLNGVRFGQDRPIPVALGERVEISFVNRTDMSHPIHLHGHAFQVIAIDDIALSGARRDTVLVPIGASVIVAFTADNPGHWALHCHNLYHMAAGMMTSVKYEG
ncbi:MAG: multicopper oxidase family protein [Dongiaceae bacterium]